LVRLLEHDQIEEHLRRDLPPLGVRSESYTSLIVYLAGYVDPWSVRISGWRSLEAWCGSFRRQKENPGGQGRGSSLSQLAVGNVGVAYALRAVATLRPVLRAVRATLRPVLRAVRAVLRTVRAVLRPVLRVARATLRPVLRAVRAVLRAVRLVVAIAFLPFGIDVAALPRLTFCRLFVRSGQVNTLFVFCPA
jgi:hypothetical protein